jgi:transaldolase/glucose-6-phosphate isomerase
MTTPTHSSLSIRPGVLADAVRDAARELDRRGVSDALARRDPALWSDDTSVQKAIANRLGWLDAPDRMIAEVGALKEFAAGVRADGVTDVVLLGMGGSSLAPEVLRAVIGVQPGWPRFTMIDSVNSDHLRSIVVDPRATLFVLASKSGSTIEPNALAAFFRQRLMDANVTEWGRHFIAITDPGSPLEEHATRSGFRRVFRNPPEIGGRYSAISMFGLVPAALMGIDLRALIEGAQQMLSEGGSPQSGEALPLGVLMGAAARQGRDKLTLVLPEPLERLALWIEQLVAESTGKNGTGILPVAGEPVSAAGEYGDDRVIVRMMLRDEPGRGGAPTLSALEQMGTPMAIIDAGSRALPHALGAEFVRWELATVTAGALLGINPFDEPNVKQAKDATRTLLDAFGREGTLPVPEPDAEFEHAAFTLTGPARRLLSGRTADRFLSLLQPGDYFAVLAYLVERADTSAVVRDLRAAVKAKTRCATAFGYGPRYLHSTGQLHKGGPNTGVFLILTAPGQDIDVPGEPFSFGVLELAQALGDFASLDQTGRRALHVHLPRADATALQRCVDRLLEGWSEG